MCLLPHVFVQGGLKRRGCWASKCFFSLSPFYLMDTTSGILPNIEQLTFVRKIVLICSICLYLWCKYFYDG